MQQLTEQQIVNQHHIILSDRWLHGIENMTYDENHCVYWKGVLIDFIKAPEQALYCEYVQDLATQCQHLESIGVPVNIETVIHFKEWFSSMKGDYKYKSLLMHCPDIRVSSDLKIIIIQGHHVAECVNECWHYDSKDKTETQEAWDYRWHQNALSARGYTGLPLSYSDLDGLNNLLEFFNVPVNLFEGVNDVLGH